MDDDYDYDDTYGDKDLDDGSDGEEAFDMNDDIREYLGGDTDSELEEGGEVEGESSGSEAPDDSGSEPDEPEQVEYVSNSDSDNPLSGSESDEVEFLPHPSLDTQRISNIAFRILSSKEVKGMGHQLTVPTTEVGDQRGVYYNALGPVEDNITCVTCGLTSEKCPGHFGYIKLPIPVRDPFHEKKIMGILNCVCMECMEVIYKPKELVRIPPTRRLKFLSDKCVQIRKRKSEKCPKCMCPLSQIRKTKKSKKEKDKDQSYLQVLRIDGVETVQEIRPHTIRALFKNINSDKKTKTLLGISNIEIDNLMIKYLPVLPSIARPYCETKDRQCDDDLTILYVNILKSVKRLNDLMSGTGPQTKKVVDVEKQITEEYNKMRFNIDALYHNKGGKAKHITGRPYKSITGRLKGKKGRVRGTCMGKRNDKGLRTVICCGADLRMDEVGISRHIAKKITVPVIVNELNYAELTRKFEGIPVLINYPRQYKAPKEPIIEKRINAVNRKEHNIDPKNPPKYFAFQIGDRITVSDDDVEKFDAKDIIKDTTNVICVKDSNYTLVESLMAKGQIVSITRSAGRFYTKNPIKHFKLQLGDECERQLEDGDQIPMNRQPTLHKVSYMSFGARISGESYSGIHKRLIPDYYVSRLPLPPTTPFNADFDGKLVSVC